MAFVRKKVRTFKWPVEVKEPSETKPGKFESHEFTAIFNRVALSVITDMVDEDENALLELILAGWEGIEVTDGDPCEAQDNTADISEMKALGWEPKVKVDEYLIKKTVAH